MNTIYDNTVLEAKLTELLNSKLEVRSLMTVDDSLTESAGLTKVINRYTYNGTVETLDGGEANSTAGTLRFTPETYTVKRYQQTFRYNDVEAMKDPALIDMALSGAADVMANQLRSEYFDQLKQVRHRYPIASDTVSYTDIVDALGNLGREVEDGLFILMGTDGQWIHFDYVPEEHNVRNGSADITGKLCVIGANLDEKGVAALFGV